MTSARPGVRRKTIGQIFGIPLLMAVLSAIGPVSALVGDGMSDAVSLGHASNSDPALRLLPAA